jgi:Complex 1 protein (LYR family)
VDHTNDNNKEKSDVDPSSISPSRSRRKNRRNRIVDQANIPSYKEFVHRFTVLSLYRNFFKAIRSSMPHNQDELRNQVRKEFKSHQHDHDPFNIQRAVAEGKRRLQELQDFTGQSNIYEGESWINTPDAEDPRGRVGQGWPWQK